MHPWFGLHLPDYTFPDTPPERLFDRVAEQARDVIRQGVARRSRRHERAGRGAPSSSPSSA